MIRPAFLLPGLLLAGLLAAGPAPAADGGLTVTQAWARPTTSTAKAGAVFVTLTNKGAATVLVGAETPAAERVELHTHVMEGAVARMRPVESIPVPAGGTATLAPGGDHLMLFGLRKGLAVGDRLPVTLRFQGGASVRTEAEVLAPGKEPGTGAAKGVGGGHHHH
ncbi:MAG TPA: copper chaperone PCu(A)C [Azospirillaceae bacterium]|nr:copper chaperone PCu(A)C [Azospirillaceae bacterium]